MKRCVLVSIRERQDETTKDELLFLTCYALPRVMTNGGLYYPKNADAIINVCINKTRAPMDYETFKNVYPGALVDIQHALNEVTNKRFVSKCDLVPNTNIYSPQDVYL
jgi:hypothetical protein